MAAVADVPADTSATPLARVAAPAVLATACVTAAFTPLGDDGGITLCPYRMVTGGWCPGCGASRALGAAVRGDLSSALTLNPIALVILAQATVLSGWALARPDRARSWWRANDWSVLRLNLVVALALWVWRLSSGAIPLPFS